MLLWLHVIALNVYSTLFQIIVPHFPIFIFIFFLCHWMIDSTRRFCSLQRTSLLRLHHRKTAGKREKGTAEL